VVVTANHWWLDGMVAILIALIVLAGLHGLTVLLRSRREQTPSASLAEVPVAS
jgi:hypothetical protein